MTVVDLWVNALSGQAAQAFMDQAGNEGIPDLLGGDLSAASTLKQLLGTMDVCGVDVGVVAAGLSSEETEPLLDEIGPYHGRLRVALVVDRPDRPVKQSALLRSLSADPAVVLVRVTPLVHQYALNDKLYYPITLPSRRLACPSPSTSASPGPGCVGLPEPRAPRGRPHRLQGPDGHRRLHGPPLRSAVMQYMLKWPDLYLSNSAYLAKYMDPALVAFMDSTRRPGSVYLRPSLSADGTPAA